MARAICESSILCGGFPEPCDMCVEKIDAILKVMREPSEEMCDCGIDTQNYWADATPESVWQAMIDAIKAGK